MMDALLDNKQREAIFFSPQKSVIVEAPPGHGKTFVMARRIEYLIESGWVKPPCKILGLTFTNSAAGEMQDDIKAKIKGEDSDLVRVMTFHSLGYKILRAYGNLIGLDRNFQIVGELERTKILRVVAGKIKVDISEDQFRQWITEKILKGNSKWNPPFDESAKLLSASYREELGVTRLDYDSLLIRLLELFKKYPVTLEMYRSVFKYILVDEFQDTNLLQFKVLSLLVFGNLEVGFTPTPVFILADKEQAIYRFQGATPENIELAKKEFKCEEIPLEHNYRCNSEEILILTRKLRGADILPSKKKVCFVISKTPTEEAQIIFSRISAYQGSLDNIAVVAQNEFRLQEIQKLLEEKKFPYVFVPDFRPKSIQKKYEEIFLAISRLPFDKKFSGKLSTRIRQIYTTCNVEENGDEVLKALLALAVNFDARGDRTTFPERALQFYNDIFIQVNWGNLLRKKVKNKIFLSTIHGVKGLQFSQVHICGLSNYDHIHNSVCYPCSFGKNRALFGEQLSNSAKTLYVGVSRAQNELFLYSTQYTSNNKRRKIICLLSPYKDFLDISGSAQFCE